MVQGLLEKYNAQHIRCDFYSYNSIVLSRLSLNCLDGSAETFINYPT